MLIGGAGRTAAQRSLPVLACAGDPELFTAEVLDAPPSRSRVRRHVWDEYVGLRDRGRAACAACPVLAECLYTAVVQVDVTGFVGCTTGRERRDIRRLLQISVGAEDLDAAAGVRANRRPLEHGDVVAARHAYPDDSLEQLAVRLGCSMSSVKRHLRRDRAERAAQDQPADRDDHADDTYEDAEPAPPTPTTPGVPTVDDVLDAFDAVVEPSR